MNDRKPYKGGTVIDSAYGAADALDIDAAGTLMLKLEYLTDLNFIRLSFVICC